MDNQVDRHVICRNRFDTYVARHPLNISANFPLFPGDDCLWRKLVVFWTDADPSATLSSVIYENSIPDAR
jgi:hypothetical protein